MWNCSCILLSLYTLYLSILSTADYLLRCSSFLKFIVMRFLSFSTFILKMTISAIQMWCKMCQCFSTRTGNIYLVFCAHVTWNRCHLYPNNSEKHRARYFGQVQCSNFQLLLLHNSMFKLKIGLTIYFQWSWSGGMRRITVVSRKTMSSHLHEIVLTRCVRTDRRKLVEPIIKQWQKQLRMPKIILEKHSTLAMMNRQKNDISVPFFVFLSSFLDSWENFDPEKCTLRYKLCPWNGSKFQKMVRNVPGSLIFWFWTPFGPFLLLHCYFCPFGAQ